MIVSAGFSIIPTLGTLSVFQAKGQRWSGSRDNAEKLRYEAPNSRGFIGTLPCSRILVEKFFRQNLPI